MTNHLAQPRLGSVKGLGPSGFHKIAYTEWGDADNPNVLICVHGLTRNSRDFDHVARALMNDFRVICPDIVGRGDSDYTHNPATYNYPQYLSDMVVLLARIGVSQVSWLGTSMGGIIGMMLAAKSHCPFKKIILNDVGMFVPKAAVERIAATAIYSKFATLDDAKKALQIRLSPFGIQGNEQWEYIAEHSFYQGSDGHFHYRYDPVLMEAAAAAGIGDVHLEPIWAAMHCPTLILRGAESDLLLPETVAQMIEMRPGTKTVTFPGCGHAPALMDAGQIQIIKDYLLEK